MKISIIIPTYNRSDKLPETVRHIEACDFPKEDFEIIIVNDHGSDNTPSLIRELQSQYPHIRYLEHTIQKGAPGARNTGISEAQGEYLLFTDDDCLVPPNWISTYIEKFEQHPEVGCIGGPLVPFSGNFFAKVDAMKDRILGITVNNEIIGGDEIATGFTNNTGFRKEVFTKAGLFDERFSVAGEEPELRRRVAQHFKIMYIPLPVKHNHDYNLDYILRIACKQGLEIMPPKGVFKKILLILFHLPRFIFLVTKKILQYRKVIN